MKTAPTPHRGCVTLSLTASATATTPRPNSPGGGSRGLSASGKTKLYERPTNDYCVQVHKS